MAKRNPLKLFEILSAALLLGLTSLSLVSAEDSQVPKWDAQGLGLLPTQGVACLDVSEDEPLVFFCGEEVVALADGAGGMSLFHYGDHSNHIGQPVLADGNHNPLPQRDEPMFAPLSIAVTQELNSATQQRASRQPIIGAGSVGFVLPRPARKKTTARDSCRQSRR